MFLFFVMILFLCVCVCVIDVCKLFLNCYDYVKHIGLPVYEMGYINKPEPEPYLCMKWAISINLNLNLNMYYNCKVSVGL